MHHRTHDEFNHIITVWKWMASICTTFTNFIIMIDINIDHFLVSSVHIKNETKVVFAWRTFVISDFTSDALGAPFRSVASPSVAMNISNFLFRSRHADSDRNIGSRTEIKGVKPYGGIWNARSITAGSTIFEIGFLLIKWILTQFIPTSALCMIDDIVHWTRVIAYDNDLNISKFLKIFRHLWLDFILATYMIQSAIL